MTPEPSPSPADAPRPLGIHKYLQAMAKAKASDLHLKAGVPVRLRTGSVLQEVHSEPLKRETIVQLAYEMMSPRQQAQFEKTGSVDLALELADRFRINIYRQRGNVSISVRRVTRHIQDFASLHLPPVIEKIADLRAGLVLLSGPTGSGKSTTIAAMLEHVNQTRPCHIVTIEDPIEYLYEDKEALIEQREIGIDVEDYSIALRTLMRHDPDVVLIGELRDEETFQAALRAAETGHLVFGTVHASTAAGTVTRILDLFAADVRQLVRQALAENLQAVLCQRLLPSVAKGIQHVPAVEVLLNNPTVRKLILEGKEVDLPDAIRSHEQYGMQNFSRSLMNLIEKDYIDPEVAYDVAPNPEELRMMMKGISPSQPGLRHRG